MSGIEILIADDHEVFRHVLRSLLESRPEWHICGEAADGRAAVERAKELEPDVVLLDVSMPEMSGLEAARLIRKQLPSAKILMVSQNDAHLMRQAAVDAGAQGFVAKSRLSLDLFGAIEGLVEKGGKASDQDQASQSGIAVRKPKFVAPMPESAEMLAAIVASSDDAIVSKSLDGIIATWNQGAEHIFGYTAEEAIGQPITMIIPPERRGEEVDILARLRRGERVDHFQTVRMRKDGTTLDVSLTISPVRDTTGRVIGASKVARDISRQRRAEEALHESQLRLAAEADALAKMNDWSWRLWRSRTLQEGLDEMLTAIMELLGADRGNIQIFNREHSVLTMAAHAGFQQDFLDFFREVSADDGSACGRALHSGERVVIEDVEEDAAFAPLRQVARAAGFRAVVSTPLIAADRSPLGVVSVHFHSVHRPAAQELRRLDLYIRQAADFIQRCQIDKVLRESEERFRKLSETLDAEVRAHTKELEERNNDVLRQAEQLRELSWRLLQAQEEERRHIARELHDSAGQTLTVLGMSLAQLVQKTGRKAPEFATEAEKIQEIVQQLHREIRTASYLLHPPLLDESGLSSALDWYVQGLSERSGLQITLEVAEEVDRLPGDMELLVFRLVQECLTNIHRHSGSQTALIRITRQAERVAVEVRDYGRGMSPERLAEIQSRGSGVGIRGMRERVRQFRGTLNIESGPSGTQVSISIPIPKSATPEEQKGSKPLQVAV